MSKDERTLMQRLVDAGYPAVLMFHHCSDLYVYVTNITTEVIDKWCEDNGYSKEQFISTFRDDESECLMYDCAFQYIE